MPKMQLVTYSEFLNGQDGQEVCFVVDLGLRSQILESIKQKQTSEAISRPIIGMNNGITQLDQSLSGSKVFFPIFFPISYRIKAEYEHVGAFDAIVSEDWDWDGSDSAIAVGVWHAIRSEKPIFLWTIKKEWQEDKVLFLTRKNSKVSVLQLKRKPINPFASPFPANFIADEMASIKCIKCLTGLKSTIY